MHKNLILHKYTQFSYKQFNCNYIKRDTDRMKWFFVYQHFNSNSL